MPIDSGAALQAGATVVAAFVGWGLSRWFERRPRLIAYYGHASAFWLRPPDKPPFTVHTHAVVVRNVGRKTATNVRLSHFTLPSDFNLWPEVQYRVDPVPGSPVAGDIVIPTLIPGDQVTINYLYFPPLTFQGVNRDVRSDEGFARVVAVLPQPQPSKAVLTLLRALLLVGTVTVLYLLFIAGKALYGP